MKVWILKTLGNFLVADFEYEVPHSPLDGEDSYLMPSIPFMNTEPPAVGLNEIAIAENWEKESAKWVIKSCFVGVMYWLPDGSMQEIKNIGEVLPEGALSKPPLSQKQLKQQLLDSITVTTQSGNVFDGNETARGDMMAALTAGELLGETETFWKMANNDKVLVTRDELLEALSLAIKEKGRIVGAIE